MPGKALRGFFFVTQRSTVPKSATWAQAGGGLAKSASGANSRQPESFPYTASPELVSGDVFVRAARHVQGLKPALARAVFYSTRWLGSTHIVSPRLAVISLTTATETPPSTASWVERPN
jgi:hypothetical protein